MKKILVRCLLVIGVLGFNGFAETVTYDSYLDIKDEMDKLNISVVDQQKLVSKLSDDIGLMADRILEMSDRIVTTEDLLAQTLTTLLANPELSGESSANATALTSPSDNTIVGVSIAPTITMIPAATVYLLYASTTPTFSAGNTISIYIDSNEALTQKWSQVASFAGSTTIYIAVKRINGNTISSLSNGVKVSF